MVEPWLNAVALSKLFGGKSRVFFEDFGEVALIFETHSYGNVDNGIFRVGQKTLTLFDPDHVQVFFKRGAGQLFEQG